MRLSGNWLNCASGGYERFMARYVTQRDPDATWSVREADTNVPAIDMGNVMVGLTEQAAALAARKFNNWGLVRANATPPIPPAPGYRRTYPAFH